MCLYPRIIENRKYRANKKNGGIIPPIKDHRTRYVPIGCQTCIECRKQKARNWTTRLYEDIKRYRNGKFVTLTYTTESLKKIIAEDKRPKTQTKNWKDLKELQGYDLDNAIVTRSVRLFLERWRKKYKKSLRHWLVTELGDGQTEHVHLHGIVWTDNIEDLKKIWGYGNVWAGYTINGIIQNYVTERTVNYIVKYITKIDLLHLNYKTIILCSPGIGDQYTKTINAVKNKYNEKETNETYRTTTGHQISLPIYWRNKIYTEEEREKLWIKKLDKAERWVCGENINIATEDGENDYYSILEYHRQRTSELGYPRPEFIWKKKTYEEQRRKMIQEKRLKDADMI